jgi:tetratricopeptide (TPR) repeat protein
LPLTKLSSKAAEIALDGLRDRALLVEDDVAGTWWFPPLAARFLRRARPEAVGASGDRLANWAYACAVENGYGWHSPTLEEAWPQLVAAFPVLLAGDNTRLQAVCRALYNFLNCSGRWDDLVFLNAEAEAKAHLAKDFTNCFWRACDSGWCFYLRGQPVELAACVNRVAAYAEKAVSDFEIQVSAIRLRGLCHSLKGDKSAALIAFSEAIALGRRESPKGHALMTNLIELGVELRNSDQLDEAELHFREALTIAEDLRDADAITSSTGRLAELALVQGQWLVAEGLATKALKRAEGMGRQDLVAANAWRLAEALAQQGRGHEGKSHAEQAVAIFTNLGHRDLAKAQGALAMCQSC